MTGFKNFLLRGNLVEVAIAFITGGAFATVVTAFVKALTSELPKTAAKAFDDKEPWGHFLNATIAFVILMAILYFCIVVPYTRAKARFFPTEAAGPTEVELLTEIRDSLAAGGRGPGQP
jgi:large conductance mechanosensitive channel